MPFYILVTAAICYVWGIRVLPDALIAFLVIYLFTLLMYYFQNPIFPFASEKSAVQGGSAPIKVFGLLAVAAAVGFLHKFLLHWFTYSNLMLIPVYVAIILYVNKIMVPDKISWKAVDRVNVY